MSITAENLNTDIIIATDLTLPGGNASSTLDELNFLNQHKIPFALVHLSDSDHVKWSDRYEVFAQHTIPAENVQSAICKTLLVRHPRALSSTHLPQFLQQTQTEHTAFVINNSCRDKNHEKIFDYGRACQRLLVSSASVRSLHPLSPRIRQEMELGPDWIMPFIADTWPPTIDTGRFDHSPKQTIPEVPLIGRHSRDGPEKWPETEHDLRCAYPDDASCLVSVLGGASTARTLMNESLPNNWHVREFGSMEPEEFLATLDVYVYIPHSGLDEAFGRGPLEAMAMGLPCILPRRFQLNFGEMAFYAEPEGVSAILDRLKMRPQERVAFLECVKQQIVAEFGSHVLKNRFSKLFSGEDKPRNQPALSDELKAYRRWVETGKS